MVEQLEASVEEFEQPYMGHFVDLLEDRELYVEIDRSATPG